MIYEDYWTFVKGLPFIELLVWFQGSIWHEEDTCREYQPSASPSFSIWSHVAHPWPCRYGQWSCISPSCFARSSVFCSSSPGLHSFGFINSKVLMISELQWHSALIYAAVLRTYHQLGLYASDSCLYCLVPQSAEKLCLMSGSNVTSCVWRGYVALARRVTPYVPEDLCEYMASAYATLRQEEVQSDAPHSYTTARTLLSIIRVSEVCGLAASQITYFVSVST